MMSRPRSILILTLGAVVLVGIGLYFALLRPPLLVEDARFMGASREAIERAIPGLAAWLGWVFKVMGGFIVASGLLTAYLANTALRARAPSGPWVIVISGLVSIGWMAIINLAIDSDFKWPLVVVALLWPLSLALYWLEGRQKPTPVGSSD